MIIAIDGPAAAGKGTLARRLAAHFGYPHLDTGALYRAVARRLLEAGGDPADADAALAAARLVTADELDDPRLRDEAVGRATSIVSAHPAVRAALLDFQRRFAHAGPGAVLDGRDIGTVVCPDAGAKLFVTASPEARAARRAKELRDRGVPAIDARVLQDIKERDARDSSRSAAPLAQAADAYVLDTTQLDPDGALAAALAYIATRET
ncbi:cytidylate kinase [Stella humosa]|uniref:Cytidylate kinase n=1 Tax=Stella humosa TaxID=94 RepID=A0A3N1LGN9_9PROT|nr:(d)CMP kinase [Stella humosa]ROP90667.1 cytidylate kinase [Stella humosa]BBK29434.1 cytidylate kinase [Stella humosa]